jgi:hypothetical protein
MIQLLLIGQAKATLRMSGGVRKALLLSLAACTLACTFALDLGSGCKAPPPATGFKNSQYQGLWYEIGKIQTAGKCLH